MKNVVNVIIVLLMILSLQALGAVIADPTVYSGTASSEFSGGGYEVDNLFDNTVAQWAINGATNPQGRYEGWIAVTLSGPRTGIYAIDAIRFAPRVASGLLDGTESMHVWISETPFGVNVQNAGETAAFWGSASVANLAVNSFADAAVHDYSLDSGTAVGTYMLARFIGWNDGANTGNLGGSYFLIDGNEVVPEPGTFAFLAVASGVLLLARKRNEKLVSESGVKSPPST